MPGRTLATWYGRSKLHTTEEGTSEGSGGDPTTDSNYPSEPPYYTRTPPQPGVGGQYAPLPPQYDANYTYYQNLNQTPVANTGTSYPEQHRNYPPPTSYPQQYAPQSPSSPVGSYYPNPSQTHHEMSYPNSQGAYNPNPAPGHYNSPNHSAQGNNYPSGWTPQQSAADYTHHSPQQVLSGSPAATPSPAHTPTPTGSIQSPPPGMVGQYPAHHHHASRHPALVGATPAQSHGHPAWSHQQQQAMSVHPGAVPLPSQAAGYFPPPLASRGLPQLAHMASDRHSPHPAWGGKTSHGPQNNGAPGNPLFSLQMLVNQSEMNRAAQANPYRGAATSLLAETVDLSTSTSEASQSAPISLTRSEKASDHSSLRNGSVPPTSTVTGASVKSPLTPINGDASSDSGISSSTPTPADKEPKEATGVVQARQDIPKNLVSQPPEKKLNPIEAKEGSSSDRKVGSPAKITKDLSEKASSKHAEVSVLSSAKLTGHLSVPQPSIGLSSSPVRSPKSAAKRVKKVDSILENLVESGSIKVPVVVEPGIPTPVIASVIVAREIKKEEPSVSDVAKDERNKSPEREEVSPTNFDDESGKPRRKRKLDKPLRVSKTDEVDNAKPPRQGTSDNVKVGEVTKDEVSSLSSDVVKSEETGQDSASAKSIISRRRTSSEGSEPNSGPSGKRVRRKSESDQVKSEPPGKENSFIEVESELEKMFAGIEGMDEPKASTSSAPAVTTPSSHKKSAKGDKRGRPKGSKNEPKSSDGVSDLTPESPSKKCKKRKKSVDSVPKKKGKGGKLFPEESERKLGARCDDSGSNASTGKIRGPLIRLLGTRESPCSVNVYNAPSQVEEGEKPVRLNTTSGRRNYSDLDYRGKLGGNGLGMFTSTLSSRYDSHTRDPTWLCAFCKRGPHSNTSVAGVTPNGDLFGPYVVARERGDAAGAYMCLDAGADDKDISAEQKKGGKNKKSLRKADMVEQFKHKMSKKAKRAQSVENAAMPGLIPLPSSSSGGNADQCYEVWVHEDCALWASGTRIVGSRIYGLQDAIWGAVTSMCNKCGHGGANVSCIARNCALRLHFHCAQQLGWDLDEVTYIARCSRHRPDQMAVASTSKVNKSPR